ncbi:MAG: pyridoxamine 5'-phosphate oxidase family protein [Pseudomonadota bacterium]
MPDPWHDLAALEAHLWTRLIRGAADAADPFRLVAFATTGADGPEVRTVALRAADRGTATVEVHSDLRTAKVRALRDDPRAALLLWDAGTQEQLRLVLDVALVIADPARWDGIPEASRTNYGTDPAPGTPVPAPEAVTRRPDPARHVALVGQVLAMDAVSLAHTPHRRARFDSTGPRWIAP